MAERVAAGGRSAGAGRTRVGVDPDPREIDPVALAGAEPLLLPVFQWWDGDESEARVWQLAIPIHPTDLLSANHRDHWAQRARKTSSVRQQARLRAGNGLRRGELDQLEAADVTVVVHPPDRRKRDAHNTLPTIKAAVDGLVDAGVLPDDSDVHVRSLRIEAGDVAERGVWVFVIRLGVTGVES